MLMKFFVQDDIQLDSHPPSQLGYAMIVIQLQPTL